MGPPQRVFSGRSGGADEGQLLGNSAPMDATAASFTWKHSPAGARQAAHEDQPVSAPRGSPRLAGTRQERYPVGGIRSRPAK